MTKTKTYTIIQTSQGPCIRCEICRFASFNHHDVEQKYCATCHTYHDDPIPDVKLWNPNDIVTDLEIRQKTIVGLREEIQLCIEAINLLRSQVRQQEKRIAKLEKG